MAQEKSTTNVIFAARLREAMDRRALTQTQLAEATGVTQSAVSLYLKGRVPNGEALVSVAMALGTTAESLMGRKEMRVNNNGMEWQHRALAAEHTLLALKAAMASWIEKI